jgi:hypothetical protein
VSTSIIEAELLGAEAAKSSNSSRSRPALSNGAPVEVGTTVYFTVDGARKAMDEVFRAVDAKDVDDLVAKAATFFGQQLDQSRVRAFTAKIAEKIEALKTTPFTVIAVSSDGKVDIKGGPPFDQVLSGIPTSLLYTKEAAGSMVDFFKRSYGPLPLWQWSLIGVGAVGAGALVVRAIRRS